MHAEQSTTNTRKKITKEDREGRGEDDGRGEEDGREGERKER